MVLVDEVIEDRRLNLVVLGLLAFVLWEGYWIWGNCPAIFRNQSLAIAICVFIFHFGRYPAGRVLVHSTENPAVSAPVPLAASHTSLTLKLQILKRLLHEACQHAD